MQGRESITDRYRRRYPDPSAMGTLRLEVVEFRPAWGIEASVLGDAEPSEIHAASIVARWTLSWPDKEAATGLTLMVFERRSGAWRIVQDASM